MKTLNIDYIRNLGPCYDPSQFLPEDWEGTVLDILNVNDCPPRDRLWVVISEDFIDDKTLRIFAVWCAREALKLISNPDPRSVAACDVAEQYANGECGEGELSAAWEAARDAAWEAARDAEGDAEGEPSWEAARDAASAAARDAASAAAWDAASAAARDAAREAAGEAAREAAREAAGAAQIEQLKHLLTHDATPKQRLEEIRAELRAERISYGEIFELQNLVEYIEPGDVELLEAAGVPEFPEEEFRINRAGGFADVQWTPEIQADFQRWKDDGNVIRKPEGHYSTQECGWSNKIADLQALKQHFLQEYYETSNYDNQR